MKITKNVLKRLIKEEIGRYILYEQHIPGPRDRTEIPGHGRPPEGAPTPEYSEKTPLSRDEEIEQWATQIVSITKTSKDIHQIAELASKIVLAAAQ